MKKPGLAAGVVIAGLLVSAGAEAAEPRGVEETNCEGVQALVTVPFANVDAVVPHPFTPKRVDGMAQLEVGVVRCELVAVDPPGSARATTFATFRATVDNPCDSPEAASLRCDEDEVPPGYLDVDDGYTFWIATDNPDLAAYYRDQGGVPARNAVHVTDLEFRLAPAFGRFTFEAPSAPSPFEMTGDVGPPLGGPLNVSAAFWAAVPSGAMKQRPNLIDLLQVGDVSGRVEPEPGSEMDRIFCGADRSFSTVAGGSLRIAFRRGRYTARVRPLDTARTARPTCPPGT